ncbi:hemocyte protein-glutamine gamma-glutamyltransferase-like isoform X1 [Dermacentor variabilis]|uniref:hemocyte protein-glutamine gamma-glutamyltransferase-like isoform X1 n=1 Tax=Dermacentor variabilis TaxID=34621 RepID=UPI003F5C96D1
MPRVPRHLAAAFAGPFLLVWWSLAEVSAQGVSGVNVNLFLEENAVVHHTEPFKILRGHAPSLVLRRGFAFKLGVTAPASNVAIILSLGDNPQPGDGSLVQLPVPGNPQSVSTYPAAGQDQWTLALEHQEGPMRLIRIQIPVTVGVGRWILTITGDGQNFRVRESLYILFNPWHNGDLVFMEHDQARAFYVMQDRGLVYHGQVERPDPKEWYYGQFEKATLPTAEFLLNIRELPISERGNPIAVSRALTSGVNSKDNNGVIQGKWSPPYSNGVHPYAWSSSSAIINQYMELGGNTVLYGQCFTFAGVLNTLLRAMGMPSRVVTNFPSVHTDNGAQVLDIRFTNEGAKPQMAGSIWNYHVWNEGWMRRPDLPGGYDGWQVLDGTPQGLSIHSRLFEVGPFPVRGVFDDKIDMPFDGNVARAAVKATYRYFIADLSNPSGWRLVKVQENECGKLIATEAIGTGMLEDITHNYKRRPMPMARHSVEELVTVKLRHEKSLPLGQPIAVTCVVSNHLEKRFYAQLTIIVTSVTYNNRFPRTISTKVYNVTMSAGGADSRRTERRGLLQRVDEKPAGDSTHELRACRGTSGLYALPDTYSRWVGRALRCLLQERQHRPNVSVHARVQRGLPLPRDAHDERVPHPAGVLLTSRFATAPVSGNKTKISTKLRTCAFMPDKCRTSVSGKRRVHLTLLASAYLGLAFPVDTSGEKGHFAR